MKRKCWKTCVGSALVLYVCSGDPADARDSTELEPRQQVPGPVVSSSSFSMRVKWRNSAFLMGCHERGHREYPHGVHEAAKAVN